MFALMSVVDQQHEMHMYNQDNGTADTGLQLPEHLTITVAGAVIHPVVISFIQFDMSFSNSKVMQVAQLNGCTQ